PALPKSRSRRPRHVHVAPELVQVALDLLGGEGRDPAPARQLVSCGREAVGPALRAASSSLARERPRSITFAPPRARRPRGCAPAARARPHDDDGLILQVAHAFLSITRSS